MYCVKYEQCSDSISLRTKFPSPQRSHAFLTRVGVLSAIKAQGLINKMPQFRKYALSSVFAIVVFPKLVAVYYPEVAVTVGYTQWNPGGLFRSGREVFDWITFQGLVITQLDTNLVSAIIGLYFGGSLVKK